MRCVRLTSSLSRYHLKVALVVGVALASAPGADAQESSADASAYAAAFAGNWLIFDNRYAGNRPCRVHLKAEGTPLRVVTQDCHSGLADVANWQIEAGQLQLLTASGPFAKLGGTTARISGWDAFGAPLVLDRDTGSVPVDPTRFARETKGCWFLGYSSQCASPTQALKPAPQKARICTFVDLRLRADARPETAVVGVLPAQTCIVSEVCVDTSTGPWCFIRFDGAAGWARQHVLRQEEWPVLTFVAGENGG